MKITILLVLISSFCLAAVLFTVPQLVFGIAVQINPWLEKMKKNGK